MVFEAAYLVMWAIEIVIWCRKACGLTEWLLCAILARCIAGCFSVLVSCFRRVHSYLASFAVFKVCTSLFIRVVLDGVICAARRRFLLFSLVVNSDAWRCNGVWVSGSRVLLKRDKLTCSDVSVHTRYHVGLAKCARSAHHLRCVYECDASRALVAVVTCMTVLLLYGRMKNDGTGESDEQMHGEPKWEICFHCESLTVNWIFDRVIPITGCLSVRKGSLIGTKHAGWNVIREKWTVSVDLDSAVSGL